MDKTIKVKAEVKTQRKGDLASTYEILARRWAEGQRTLAWPYRM